jgi:hypothetical protein
MGNKGLEEEQEDEEEDKFYTSTKQIMRNLW